MKKIFLMILMVSALCGKAQNETYYAKQMQKQVGSEFESINDVELFHKIVFLDSAIQITTGNGKIVLFKYNDVNKVQLQGGAYRYEFNFDIMIVALFFVHLPYEEGDPQLAFAMLKIPKTPSKKATSEDDFEFYKIVFQDFLVIK